jgi:hypothetical protein
MKQKVHELQKKIIKRVSSKFHFLTLLAFFAITGCNDGNDPYIPTYTPPATENIEGSWELSNVSGGIAGTYDDFAPNEVVWIFNEESQTVTVFNNNTDDNKVDFFDSGTYDYEVVINQTTPELCGFNFAIDGVNLGCFTVTEEQFKMSMIEADGHIITLKRIITFD